MKKIILFTHFLMAAINLFGQNDVYVNEPFLTTDDVSNRRAFIGFAESEEGQAEHTIIAKNQNAQIIANGDNIGKMILHVRLDPIHDSIPNNYTGSLSINAQYIDKATMKEVDNELRNASFEFDKYQQIYISLEKPNIKGLQLLFDSDKHSRFVIEKFEVFQFNNKGVSYYQTIDEVINNVNREINNLPENTERVANLYIDELTKMDDYHKILSQLTTINDYNTISLARAKSLNPFLNEKFKIEMDEAVSKATEIEQEKYSQIINHFSNEQQENRQSLDLKNIVTFADELLTGGKFSSIISLIDGLFKREIKLSEVSPPIIPIANDYFTEVKTKTKGGKSILTLEQIIDPQVQEAITLTLKKNEQLKSYIEIMARYSYEDDIIFNNIDNEMQNVVKLRNDIEVLGKKLLEMNEIKNRNYIKDGEFSGTRMTKIVDQKKIKTFNEYKKFEEEYKYLVSEMDEIERNYNNVVGHIKGYYESIYDINPRKREAEFQSIIQNTHNQYDLSLINEDNLLPEFTFMQKAIYTSYNSDNEFQKLLKRAVGE